MHVLDCGGRRVLFNVTVQRMEILEECVCLRLQMSLRSRLLTLAKVYALSALPVKPATNYCQRSKVLHLLLSFLI